MRNVLLLFAVLVVVSGLSSVAEAERLEAVGPCHTYLRRIGEGAFRQKTDIPLGTRCRFRITVSEEERQAYPKVYLLRADEFAIDSFAPGDLKQLKEVVLSNQGKGGLSFRWRNNACIYYFSGVPYFTEDVEPFIQATVSTSKWRKETNSRTGKCGQLAFG